MKHFRYLWYLARHKWYVLIECMRLGWQERCFCKLLWLGLVHDLSKFSTAEWSPYVEWFFGSHKGSIERDNFLLAWKHHQNFNPHHWQHWLIWEDDVLKALPMPYHYILEMVADWRGAGKAITGKDDILQWYEGNKDSMFLNPKTRTTIQYLLYVAEIEGR